MPALGEALVAGLVWRVEKAGLLLEQLARDPAGGRGVATMTEFELFQALRPYYPAREYALLPQVANGTGVGAFRHCDALALSLWPSRGLHLSGFEMKSYRGDWM